MSTTATATPGLGRIAQIAINVRDLPRATAFWRDALGIKLLFEVPDRLAFFDCDGVRAMLSRPERPEFDHPSSILYFRAADIHATHGRLVAAGVTFEATPFRVAKMPDHDLWIAFFRDTEGNPLALMSEVREG